VRILQVVRSVDPVQGGPVTATLETATQLVAQGHQVEVVALDHPEAPHLAHWPVPVHAIGAGRGRYGFNRRLPRWIMANAQRFDAAVLHGVWDYASYGGRLGLKRARLPYVIYPHGMLDPWFQQGRPIKTAVKQVYWLLGGGAVLAGAHRVLFTCEEERRLAKGSFVGPAYREQVVAYGAPEPPHRGTAQVAAFRQGVPALGEQRYLLFLGRMHPKKGVDLLLSAFCELAERHRGFDLVMAGPDPMGLQAAFAEELRTRRLAERVHWVGMLEGERKWGALAGAEAFVLPSHQENFGIAVAEAMACGTPVLISDKVNIWREIVAGGGGMVGEDTLAGTLGLLGGFLALPEEARAAMGSAARRTYERQFTMEAASRALLEVLEDAVRERGR
jgi:glycosyltransferase involved in cell wall biosynthesis